MVEGSQALADSDRKRPELFTRTTSSMRDRLRPLTARPLLIVFLVALLARVVFVVAQLELQLFDIAFDATDSSLYRRLAEGILSGQGFVDAEGEPTAFVGIGYPAFLALLFQISDSTLFIALVQSVIGAATVSLIAWMGGRLGQLSGAWIAGIAAAFYPHLIFWTGYVLTETIYVFLLVAAVAAAVAASREGDNRVQFAAVSGVAFGCAALVRPIALGLGLLFVALAFFLRLYRTRALVGLAALALIMAPWVVRNAIQLGAPVVTSTESGYVLWQGNSPGANGGTRGYVDELDFKPLNLSENLSEVERDAEYRRQALRWMARNPNRVLELVPKKLWNMWRPTYEGASTINNLVTYATYLPLLVGALMGLYRARRHPIGILLLTVVGYHLLVHGLVTGMIRFRLPVEAILLVALAGLVVSQTPSSRSKESVA